jgi:hypothetical protein
MNLAKTLHPRSADEYLRIHSSVLILNRHRADELSHTVEVEKVVVQKLQSYLLFFSIPLSLHYQVSHT